MLGTAATHPSCSESEPENSSGFTKPLSIRRLVHTTALSNEGELAVPLPCSLSGLFPAFGGLGHYRLLQSRGTWWKIHSCCGNAELVQTPPALPKRLRGGGRLWAGSMAGGWVWVGEVWLFFWCALKTWKLPAAARVVPGELSPFCKGVGTKLGERRLGLSLTFLWLQIGLSP